jgi:twitching motility two-component system response regulator PilG
MDTTLPSAGGSMKMKKVLIVEDSPTTRAIVKVYLVGQHLDFLEADDGREGLALARSAAPDAIVLDLKLPGMDGLAFCRAVRADPLIHDTPIILVTSSKDEAVRREALRAGVTHFMTKPIDGKALAERIVECLKKK